MSTEPFSIVKMFAGLLTGTHWAKTIAFSLSAGFLIFVGLGVYRGYFKTPEPTTSQSAESINNYNYTPKVSFGCATVRTYKDFPTNRIGR